MSNFKIKKSCLPSWHSSYSTTATDYIDIDDVLITGSGLTSGGTPANQYKDGSTDASSKYYTLSLSTYPWMCTLSNAYYVNNTTPLGIVGKSAPMFYTSTSSPNHMGSKSYLSSTGTYTFKWKNGDVYVTPPGGSAAGIGAYTPVLYVEFCGGGGGGGGGKRKTLATNIAGGGGGGAGVIRFIINLAKVSSQTATFYIAGGGSGGASSDATEANAGSSGGNSYVTVGGKTFYARGGGGGKGGHKDHGGNGGAGGTADAVSGVTGCYALTNATGGDGGAGNAVGSFGGNGEPCKLNAITFSPLHSKAASEVSGGNIKGSSNNTGGGGGGGSWGAGSAAAYGGKGGAGAGGSGYGNVGASGEKNQGGAGGDGVLCLWWWKD